jgi:hypothetical protein
MKFGWLILRLHVVDLISTCEIKITSGTKFTSMILKLPCELQIWSLDSKSRRRDLLGTCIPTFYGICKWNKIMPRHGISCSLMMTRNIWTKQTLDNIDWEAHGASQVHHRAQRCFLVKLCHRHLPIGQTLHCRDDKYSPTCSGR